MQSIRRSIRGALLVGISVMLAIGSPMAVFADEAPAVVNDVPATTAAPQSGEGSEPAATVPESTTAPDSTKTAEGESTPAPTPKPVEPKKTYTYDASSGRWNSNEWTYDTNLGKYTQTKPPVVVAPSNDTKALSSVDSETTTAIANALDSMAISGDASVLKNTAAGSATTGNASSAATIINNVNSTMSNTNNKEAASFALDVVGDVNGDIMLQPMLLKAMLESAAQQQTTSHLNSTTTTGIQNDITLGAQSGDAAVSGNTAAGSATSGSANTVANVLNLVNSMIAANQSFVGTINIYGNLNGDILIAPDFIPQLIAANGGSNESAGSASITSNDTQSIVNNIALSAQSGQALVENNTEAGSATTGDAKTNAVIFNLTGHEVVASNSLLVFVNVLGRWVGVIVDAPTGATSAMIGDNVTKNEIDPNLSITATNDTALTNNITLDSQSGDASVTSNTKAGDARTGNATASANVANISNSSISTGGWIGILFINVFGEWLGSLGLETDAGNPVAVPVQESPATPVEPEAVQVFSFIPEVMKASAPLAVVQGGEVRNIAPGELSQSDESLAQEVRKVIDSKYATQSPEPAATRGFNMRLAAGSLVVIMGALIGIRRYVL